MKLSDKQALSIAEATAEACIWHGAVRSGKTTASVIAFLDAVARTTKGGGRIVIIGRTMDTIYRNVISEMYAVLGPNTIAVRYTRGANVAHIFGHEVDIIGASDARSEGRIRGMTIKIAYVDEASLLPDEGFWEQLLNRQLTVDGSQTFATTNPDHPQHWLLVNVIERADLLGYRVWHFDMDDNPALTEDAKAQARKVNTGVFYQRNVLGLWVLAEGVIWPAWTDKVPIVTDADMPAIDDYVVAIDYGTHGVHAALLLGRGADRRIYVCSEWRWEYKTRQRALSDVEMSESLRRWLDELDPATNAIESRFPGAREPGRIVVDPSASSLIEQMHRHGWHRVRTADNEVLPGLRSVDSLMAAGRLAVHEDCAGLRKEVPGYVWDDKAAEDKPVKVNDHSCDALRYGVMGSRRWWRDWLRESFANAA